MSMMPTRRHTSPSIPNLRLGSLKKSPKPLQPKPVVRTVATDKEKAVIHRLHHLLKEAEKSEDVTKFTYLMSEVMRQSRIVVQGRS